MERVFNATILGEFSMTVLRTRYRRICWTWILTVLKDSLSSLPSTCGTTVPDTDIMINVYPASPEESEERAYGRCRGGKGEK